MFLRTSLVRSFTDKSTSSGIKHPSVELNTNNSSQLPRAKVIQFAVDWAKELLGQDFQFSDKESVLKHFKQIQNPTSRAARDFERLCRFFSIGATLLFASVSADHYLDLQTLMFVTECHAYFVKWCSLLRLKKRSVAVDTSFKKKKTYQTVTVKGSKEESDQLQDQESLQLKVNRFSGKDSSKPNSNLPNSDVSPTADAKDA